MAVDPTVQSLQLKGADAFINGITMLNNIGAIYGNGKGAKYGRSITLEDIEQYSSYTHTIGNTVTYTEGNFFKEIKDGEENIIGYEMTLTAASETDPITMTENSDSYRIENYCESTTIYNMLCRKGTDTGKSKDTYWLTSRSATVYAPWCDFNIAQVQTGAVQCVRVYGSSDNHHTVSNRRVVPVIALRTNIKTTGQDENGVWQLDV